MRLLHNGRAAIVGCEKVDLSAYPDLEVIGCNMTGTEHLPWEDIQERNIKVFSLKGETEFLGTIKSTAEHTVGLMFALMRNYKSAFAHPELNREVFKGHTLNGKTLGIIGFGRVGNQVAQIASSLGMKWLATDKEGATQSYDNLVIRSLLSESDIVTIHIPLDGNTSFFGRYLLEQMKPTAYLINTSRDRVIAKGGLVWALENKIIAGAAVDFTDDPELVEYAQRHDNLILTNHIGGCTYEDMERTESFIVDKVNRWFTGGVV